MKVVFRVDASLRIGTGHVMRCLTLANALAARGANCQFICRAHEGNLIRAIRGRGYVVHMLPIAPPTATDSIAQKVSSQQSLAHSHWLGATQAQDSKACYPILTAESPDWLIVDHYAIDAHWERALIMHCRKLMVIDDLADRSHFCNLLLDQTFGRDPADYRPLLPASCHLLCGTQYALIRPEFVNLRSYSLQRRVQPVLRELLISMGGVDEDNTTGKVLQALQTCRLPSESRITVVLGVTAPWQDEIRKVAQNMPWPTRVKTGVSDMAGLMADSDLAIGAAGTTSLERCCLGLPTIMLTLAENQRKVAHGLESSGGVKLINPVKDLQAQISEYLDSLVSHPVQLLDMSKRAATIIDGAGTDAVAQALEVCFE